MASVRRVAENVVDDGVGDKKCVWAVWVLKISGSGRYVTVPWSPAWLEFTLSQ